MLTFQPIMLHRYELHHGQIVERTSSYRSENTAATRNQVVGPPLESFTQTSSSCASLPISDRV